MHTSDRLQEGQRKNKEVRRSKIVLWTVAIGSVIAMTIIQVKKILNHDDLKSQKPVAQAVEKPPLFVHRDEVADDIRHLTPEGNFELGEFDEDDSSHIHKACELLQDGMQTGTNIHSSIQKAVDIYRQYDEEEAQQGQNEGGYKIPFVIGDLEDMFRACGFDEKETRAMIEDILKQGVEEGDPHIGSQLHANTMLDCLSKVVLQPLLDEAVAAERAGKSPEYEEKSFDDEEKQCSGLPDSPYWECEGEITSPQKDACDEHATAAEKQSKCESEEDDDNDDTSCYEVYRDAFDVCLEESKDRIASTIKDKCKGLSYRSPRVECYRELKKSHYYYSDPKDEEVKVCYDAEIRKKGLDPSEVKLLDSITNIGKLTSAFSDIEEKREEEMYGNSVIEMGNSITGFFDMLVSYELDFSNEEVLFHLGVKSKAEFIQAYISPLEELMDDYLEKYDIDLRDVNISFKDKTVGQFIAELKGN